MNPGFKDETLRQAQGRLWGTRTRARKKEMQSRSSRFPPQRTSSPETPDRGRMTIVWSGSALCAAFGMAI
ncbi:hypothetical protein GCM10011507_16510 [Edaphobacter acidisoli]|uniref:Uncharacterized protein n=1 Tax=Edaphobacter acidisoli TaxID=2040573 RepID=A0A916RQM7_9BACT|nr:hypothetical protein GCM10011507_16510 [Edaphobacter acidisoli]